VRDEAYKSLLPAEKAASRTTTLMTEGRPLMPAFSMAMTQGEDEMSSDAPSCSSLAETRRPRMKVEMT
jgi:hypothetical protein